MAWQRCISTLGCSELSLDEVLMLARAHELPCVELRALSGTLDLPQLWRSAGLTPEQLAATVRASGTRVAMLDTSMKLIGGSDADRSKLLEFVPWAEALGTRYLRIFDGGHGLNEADLSAAAATLSWWREQRARHGWQVDVAVETHDSLVTAERIRTAMTRAGTFPLLWDAHNSWKLGGEPLADLAAAIHPYVVHVHCKESISQPSARHPFTYVLPGTGEFPQAELRAALTHHHYTGPLSLEWERHWHPYLAPLSEALRSASAANWW